MTARKLTLEICEDEDLGVSTMNARNEHGEFSANDLEDAAALLLRMANCIKTGEGSATVNITKQ